MCAIIWAGLAWEGKGKLLPPTGTRETRLEHPNQTQGMHPLPFALADPENKDAQAAALLAPETSKELLLVYKK